MKNLILVRHGKSSWDYSVSDKDRPLKERGINDALLVADIFGKQNVHIDAAYSSPANRALHTCMIFLRRLDFSFADFQVVEGLYDFSGESDLQFIKSLDDGLETVIIFGHNHAFTYLANSLGNSYIDNVPTSGLVHLRFDTNTWESISKGTTIQTIFPKENR
ncbi:SixA phosphatase family protein [Pseudozobellia thermophila]|uniref:Phosphohistidine phosphatase n=1 Tax=Pseudozobellia thermophila TaxID=192903 RepID=A0A1M6GS70_9FLAO|nr:histidine phosphatase family protein [Pseudozobellia thermophila]SHJ12803.1 phosphohistidine phosphatase [Pseudozobellia thermophila]